MPARPTIIVVGAGHAGCEAALAAARLGAAVTVISLSRAHIGRLSCNPAVGGLAKGHLVREIDALGGAMARVADAATIQFRRLNTRKGLAVQASRAQVDIDRDDKWDEKWTFPDDGVTRQVAPKDDEDYTESWTWTGREWLAAKEQP